MVGDSERLPIMSIIIFSLTSGIIFKDESSTKKSPLKSVTKIVLKKSIIYFLIFFRQNKVL